MGFVEKFLSMIYPHLEVDFLQNTVIARLSLTNNKIKLILLHPMNDSKKIFFC